MSRQCELSGKGVMTGNNVSHAKIGLKEDFFLTYVMSALQVINLIKQSVLKLVLMH